MIIPRPVTLLSRSARRAFTLIELLVVVAIIAVLAGLILQTSGFVQEKAATSRAKTEIAALESALESYKIDNGTYPIETTGGVNSTKPLITALAPVNGDKIYFEIPPNMLSSQDKSKSYDENLAASSLVDPFGNAYRYYFDPSKASGINPAAGNGQFNGPAFFDLWSRGKKNSDDQLKWITNW